MKSIFNIGDKKSYTKVVKAEEVATFESGNVHPVYATFAIGRDAEWACRLFVLEMKEEDEEGIGTSLSIIHVSPALVGSEVCYESCVKSIKGNEIICSYTAKIMDRLIAHGEAGQKIVKKEKLERIFLELNK